MSAISRTICDPDKHQEGLFFEYDFEGFCESVPIFLVQQTHKVKHQRLFFLFFLLSFFLWLHRLLLFCAFFLLLFQPFLQFFLFSKVFLQFLESFLAVLL
jgi:hypothetical protein